MFELIVAAGLALVISTLCSLAEAALLALPWSYIEQLRREGRSIGHLLFKLRTQIERPISAVLTLNTVAHTAGASVAGAAAIRVFGSENMGLFVAVFTILILVISEIVPKTVGVAYSRQIMLVFARPLEWLVLALSPVIWVTGYLGRMVRPADGPETTEDDITAIVSLTRKSGVIQPYEEMAIRNILTLDTKTVSDIMTPRTVVFSLPAQMSVSDARSIKNFWHYSRIPVYDNDDPEDVVGLVLRRAVLETLADDHYDARIIELMQPVRFVVETLSLDRLLVKFLESRTHLFVVLDEYGGVAGVVTLEDVLEEILGKEIVDETDQVADMRALARKQRQQLTKLK
jgi:CBS domain containing-hemolysin-like protein